MAPASGASSCSFFLMRWRAARRAERGPSPGTLARSWIRRSISGPAIRLDDMGSYRAKPAAPEAPSARLLLADDAGRRRRHVEGRRDQRPGVVALRVFEDLPRGAFLDHLAAAHDDDMVGERAHHLQI